MADREPMDPGTPPPPGEAPPPREAPPPPREAPPRRKSSGKRLLWTLLAVAVAFLAGFGWQYYNARNLEARLAQTEQELAVERLRVGLAQAAVAAQSGDYEAARRQMSDFFTALQQRLEELPEDVRVIGSELLLSRDEVITDLSRAAPESADVLYDMLVRFRTSLGDAPPQAAPAPADTG